MTAGDATGGTPGGQPTPRPEARGPLPLGASATDPTVAGHKAARLAWLTTLGFEVPEGVVLPTGLLETFVAAAGDGSGPAAVRDAAVPEPLRAAVAAALEQLGEGPLAVRSSGVAEDTDDASYAGHYESVLGVHGVEETLAAVRRCVASAFAGRVSAYHDHARSTPGLAVLVQRMVDAEAAGVAFTANPVTGDRDETLVSAVRGLGDRLVGGEAVCDEWLVRDGEASCLAAPQGALDAETVNAVAALAGQVEARFGAPQDIEWAVADGEVHLLQARPITALPTPPEIDPPPGSWQKDTTHYTGPISPLAATAYLPRLEAGAERMLADFGFLMASVRQRAIGHEVYIQPVPPDDEVAAERIATAAEALGLDLPSQLVEQWWHGGWREDFRDRFDALRDRDLAALDADALGDHLDACLGLLADGQVAHFQLFPPWMLAAFDLATTCDELLGWTTAQAVELVSGRSSASAEPHRELARLAADVRADGDATSAVTGWAPGQPVSTLLARLREADPALAERLTEHLDRDGCRVPAYDVADPTFAERPELTLRALRDLVAGAGPVEDAPAELARRREQAAARARAALADRDDREAARARFDAVLARAEDVWGLREDNLLLTDAMPNGLLRLAALEIGRRLVAAGRLRRADDAVWLELDELTTALRAAEEDARDLRGRVARRRAEHAWVRANPGPPFYGDPPPSPPSVDELPAEARRLMGAMGWLMSVEFAPGADEAPADGQLRGQPGSPGRVTATARVLRDERDFDRLAPGEVIVCPLTTPAWTVLFSRAAAVITDRGSPLSHAAIVAREHAIPAVVGTGTATTDLTDGGTVTVDGATGLVSIP